MFGRSETIPRLITQREGCLAGSGAPEPTLQASAGLEGELLHPHGATWVPSFHLGLTFPISELAQELPV